MERKRIEKLVVLLLVGILMPVSLFPFRINADSYVSPSYVDNTQRDKWQNAGGNVVNFSEDPLTGSTPSKLTFTFNDNYYGFVSFQPYSGNSVWNDSTVFIAGGVGYYNYRNSSSYNPKYIDGVKITYVNLFLPDSNVDLSQIISILTAIENDTTSLDTTTDAILTDLQSVLNQIIAANGYLDILTKIRRFDIPFESLVYNLYLITNYEQYLYYDSSIYFQYPVYKFTNAKRVLQQYTDANVEYDWIFVTDCSQPALLRNYMNITNANASVTFKEFHNLGQVPNIGYVYYYHAILKSTTNANTLIDIDFSQTSPNVFVGVLLNKVGYKNYSTDFALQNGLSNNLLDNLQIIANGTQQSQSASGLLDQTTSQFSDDANDLVTIEESFNNSMNQSLQSVNPTFNMGSSFLTSANWVSQQFNRIVNNTPFASLITFGLTLGLGLLIIGKVRK